MNCPTCRAAVPDGSTVCPTCATSLAAAGVPVAAARTSGMAIAGFVLSFFCGILGLIFSILGLSQCNRSNGAVKGKGLAIAGMVISIVTLVGGMLAAVAIPAFMD